MEYLKDLDVTPILIGILFSVATLYWWCGRRSYKLPPGPIGLPLVGYLPFLDKESFKSFKKLAEKYGNIFSLYLGRNFTVVLSDYKLIKEAFNQQALLNRPPHMFDFHPDGFGFVGTNGEEWTEQRRYTMKIMRDIGLGKSQWENLLMAEVEEFRDWVKTHDGKPVNIYGFLSASVSNNMTTLVFGKRLPAGDPTRILVDNNVEVNAQVFLQSGFVSFFPKLLSLIAKLSFTQLGKQRKFMVEFSSFLKKQVEIRKKALKAEESEDVFIDGYLKEIEKNNQRNIKNTFNEKNLIGSCQAMVSAGSETTRTAILWLLLAMVTYPEVQKKVHEEIDTVLRKDGKITWKERSKLPYVNATIMESLRWKTVAPLNLLHYANADVVVSGYDIPKGSVVISNLWEVHNDPEYWKDPEKFLPERFLVEEDGKLTTIKPDGFIPFSIGRRNCPGEQVAMIEILHYFVTIMQNFQLLPEFDGKLPDLSGILGITYQCKPQKLRFVPRD